MSTIHGRHGQHATDLIHREIISPRLNGEHLVIVPITQTEKVIADLLDNHQIKQQKIVNFCGVMTKSPSNIPNLHFLFGPGAKTGLKVAQAGSITPLMTKILDAAEKQEIQVIETTRTEHDKKMVIIQGLSHLFLILVGTQSNEHIQTKLIAPWKTPIETIVDMIFTNPFVKEILIEFFETIPRHNGSTHGAFGEIVERYLTETDMMHFSTPNFERIIRFTGDISATSQNIIAQTRKNLNSQSQDYLRNSIESIRSTPSPVPLSP